MCIRDSPSPLAHLELLQRGVAPLAHRAAHQRRPTVAQVGVDHHRPPQRRLGRVPVQRQARGGAVDARAARDAIAHQRHDATCPHQPPRRLRLVRARGVEDSSEMVAVGARVARA
eukprot:4515311-Prymnesium_polylepis.1